MSIRRAGSIFDRSVKRAFNQTKYHNPTGKAGADHSHLSFFSIHDVKNGRRLFTFAIMVTSFLMYYDTGYFHETFGHFQGPPIYDNIDSALDSEERKLNRQILEREAEEHKLHNFLDIFKNYGS